MATLEEKSAVWMNENPEAMALFRKFADQVIASGRRCGIALLTERVRWTMAVETTGGEGFKVNNSYRAYLARRLIAEKPGLARLMTTRITKAG